MNYLGLKEVYLYYLVHKMLCQIEWRGTFLKGNIFRVCPYT